MWRRLHGFLFCSREFISQKIGNYIAESRGKPYVLKHTRFCFIGVASTHQTTGKPAPRQEYYTILYGYFQAGRLRMMQWNPQESAAMERTAMVTFPRAESIAACGNLWRIQSLLSWCIDINAQSALYIQYHAVAMEEFRRNCRILQYVWEWLQAGRGNSPAASFYSLIIFFQEIISPCCKNKQGAFCLLFSKN